MPKLNDHGLGGGSKALGVPVYPLNTRSAFQKDDVNGAFTYFYGDATSIATAPVSIYDHASCVYGDEMYFFGHETSSTDCYKYNVKTKEWTKIADAPTNDTKSWAVLIGTNIWYGANGYIFKYNILANEHYTIVATPWVMQSTRACTDGQYIYIFGGGTASTYRKNAYKFEVATNTFTQLTNLPAGMYYHGCVYGDDGYCYLFGGPTSRTGAYKYDIANNTYTTLATIPVNYQGAPIVKIDNYIYLIHTSYNTTPYIVAYDMITDVFTLVTDSGTTTRSYGHGGVIDGVVYLIGGGSTEASHKGGIALLLTKARTVNAVIQNLHKGSKCYTDGDVMTCDGAIEMLGQLIVSNETPLEKKNGAVTTPIDGKYVLIESTYATIGG